MGSTSQDPSGSGTGVGTDKAGAASDHARRLCVAHPAGRTTDRLPPSSLCPAYCGKGRRRVDQHDLTSRFVSGDIGSVKHHCPEQNSAAAAAGVDICRVPAQRMHPACSVLYTGHRPVSPAIAIADNPSAKPGNCCQCASVAAFPPPLPSSPPTLRGAVQVVIAAPAVVVL